MSPSGPWGAPEPGPCPCPTSRFFKELGQCEVSVAGSGSSGSGSARVPDLPGPLSPLVPRQWGPSGASPSLLRWPGPLLVPASLVQMSICLSGDVASGGLVAPSVAGEREAQEEAQPSWCECRRSSTLAAPKVGDSSSFG